MINSREWLRSRKNLLVQVKNQVRARLGPMPRSLSRYAESLDRDFGRSWRPSTARELRRAIGKSKLVLSGDFHAYFQSQRAHLRLLRDNLGDRSAVLVLECLAPKHEEICARFLRGEISESKFLEAVEWEKNWGFPWENYRPLFELARDQGLEIRGIFQSGKLTLHRRDDWMARRILEIHRELPSHLVFVVVGDWHLAASHLPRRLLTELEPTDLTVIHQDAEQLYFRLASKGKEGRVDILSTPGQRFCLIVSPPWMKWQSYLMFLEQTYDRDLNEELAIDYTEHIVSLIELLENDLKVEVKKSRIEVYCANSKTSISRIKWNLTQKERMALVYHLEHALSFYLPQRSWCYLSRPTINHASSLAGQYLHAQLCGRDRTLWNLPEDFLPLIWVEAVGFFFSKWLNPKRKSESLENIRLQLTTQDPKLSGRSALLLTLDHRMSEVLWIRTGRMRQARYNPRQVSAYLEASRILGGMLGERMFQKVRSRTISLNKLMSYLKVSVGKPGQAGQKSRADFSKFYWQLVREIEHD